MTTSSKTIHKIDLLDRLVYPCSGNVDTYGQFVVREEISADNPVETRPYPAEPLKSLTAQPMQYTQTNYWGRLRAPPIHWLNEFCNGHWVPVYRHSWSALSPGSVPAVDAPSTRWETKLRLEIKDRKTNLGASLAEYRQTASMFSRFAKGTFEAWRTFRAAKTFYKRPTPCHIAASELTMSYGILPLANDLYDSFETLQARLTEPIIVRVSVIDKARKSFSGTYEGRWDVSQRATAYLEIEPDVFFGFTLGNPLEIAWEVVPFSFVVDWALPIGDYLSALDALKGVKGSSGTLTTKRRYFHDFNYVPQPGYTLEVTPRATYFSHERSLISSIPMPRVPRWDPSTSWKSVMHGISLLTTLNKRCQR